MRVLRGRRARRWCSRDHLSRLDRGLLREVRPSAAIGRGRVERTRRVRARPALRLGASRRGGSDETSDFQPLQLTRTVTKSGGFDIHAVKDSEPEIV